MRVVILSRYYNKGGAAIAAKRLFDAISKKKVISCKFVSPQFIEKNNKKYLFSSNLLFKFYEKVIFKLDTLIFKIFFINKPLRSFNFFGLINASYFNKKNNLDIINIHWINGGCISLSNISQINKTIILTLHDSWLINKSSHYPNSINNIFEKRFNSFQKYILHLIDEKYRKYKIKKFSNISCIIVPSTWLYDLVLNDNYFSKFPLYKIPNPLDLETYKIHNKRKYLQKFTKFKIIAYYEKKSDILKGSDLLYDLIQNLKIFEDIEFYLVGSSLKNDDLGKLNNVFSFGYINDENTLVKLYNEVDICISTSRSENLSQFLTQACACSLPLIAFNVGGNSDIIHEGINGYLINDFNLNTFISKIIQLYENRHILSEMSKNSNDISKKWDPDVIALQYEYIFKKYHHDQ